MTGGLLVRPTPPDVAGCVLDITPASAGWHYAGLAVHVLRPAGLLEHTTADRETCIVVLCGQVTVEAGSETFAAIGRRSSVFEPEPPAAVYVPPGTRYRISAISDAEIALCSAPGRGALPVRRIGADEIGQETRGIAGNRRTVINVLPEGHAAESLLIAEVLTPGGHWSSYPPHKHDTDDPPHESRLEEIYYHRISPAQGFAFQRVYTDDGSIDATMTVHDGDAVLVPRGYHPVSAAYGYDLYYLNVMAGPQRRWRIRNEPGHEWILQRRE